MITSFLLWLTAFMLLAAGKGEFQTFRARLAVDYGPRLVGLATCDPFGNIKPYCTLPNQGDLSKLSRQILDKARVDGAFEILVGLPLDSNGIMSHSLRNFNGQLCLNFSSVLTSVAGTELPRCKVLLVDERYTTREAKVRMKSERIRASLDAMAAACLLQRYMEDRGEGAMEPIACPYPPPSHLAEFDYEIVRRHIRSMYYDSPQSLLARKQATMQKLKEGVLKGKHHIYFEDQGNRIAAASAETEAELRLIQAEAEAEEAAGEDNEDGDEDGDEEYEDDEIDGDVEGVGDVRDGLGMADGGEEGGGACEEEEEDAELARMMDLRSQRRKRGTLRKPR